jgi:hypothetical protein
MMTDALKATLDLIRLRSNADVMRGSTNTEGRFGQDLCYLLDRGWKIVRDKHTVLLEHEKRQGTPITFSTALELERDEWLRQLVTRVEGTR